MKVPHQRNSGKPSFTDPIGPRVVFVAGARANVTPLESRQSSPREKIHGCSCFCQGADRGGVLPPPPHYPDSVRPSRYWSCEWAWHGK